jgi:DUF917 family protein
VPALGRAIREARESGRDPVEAACAAIGGTLLFRGTVSGRDWANTGYMEGTHELEGTGDSGGHRLKVWFRNENHVTWLDGDPWVASPDLIEFCDPTTGEPLVNTYLELGQEIAVVGGGGATSSTRRPAWRHSGRATSASTSSSAASRSLSRDRRGQ